MTESATPTPRSPRKWRAGELALVVLAVIATIVALKWAAPLLIPLTAGMLIAYALRPLVEGLERIRIPRAASAMLVMAAVTALIVGAGALVKEDAIAALAELPQAARKLRLAAQENARAPNSPVGHVREAAAELNRAAAEAVGSTSAGPPTPPAPATRGAAATPPPVTAAPAAPPGETSWASQQSSKFVDTLSELGVAALFALFTLASGDTFRLKAVRLAGPKLASRRITIEILDEIDNQVQRYLLVMLITNVVIAFAIWGALAVFGLERAAMWGATAGVLHVIPYVGSLLTTIVIAIAAFLQFGTLASAAGAAVIVFAVSAAIGMGFMSWLHGRATQLNAVAVFVSLVFFGWLWGGWGLLLGAPLASILKTIADRVPALHGVGELLGR